jgi:phosphoglycolate phosphatase-like HAD superfamily hydrolase
MAIKLVCFGWSGTISDDRQAVFATINTILKENKKKEVTIKKWVNNSKSSPMDFLKTCGIKGNEDYLQELFEEKYLSTIASTPPFPCDNIKEAMEFIIGNGGLIAVISAHSEKRILAEAKLFGLENYISFISANSVSKAKDVANLCKKFKCPTSSAAYVGGTPFDIISANTVGVVSIAKLGSYYSEKDLDAAKPKHVIHKFTDLIKIMSEYATS